MSDPIQLAITKLQAKLQEHERAASKTKMAINALCEASDLPPMYADADEERRDAVSLSIRSDQFYGQPLAAAIRIILEMRRKQDRGPATVNEIYASLLEGGFAFETKNEENAKRGLRVSLTKNSVTFHRLPNGKYGLLEWYPNAKPKRYRATPPDQDNDTDGDDEDLEAAEELGDGDPTN
jgi:hypothetical protein